MLYYTSGLRTKIPKDFKLPNMIPLGKLTEDELVDEYNKCDALLFPTRLEGFGYCIAEAMSCGKPVIATSSSSIPEIFQDKINGYLIELDNYNMIIKSARRLNIRKMKRIS